MTAPQKKLLDLVRDAIRSKYYSYRTEESSVHWIKRYVLFHNTRHPRELGQAEIEAFLTYLAVEQNGAASTQNQARGALFFLYREVLRQPLIGSSVPNVRSACHLCSREADGCMDGPIFSSLPVAPALRRWPPLRHG